MNKKVMIENLDYIDNYLNVYVSKAVDDPLRLRIEKLKSSIDSLSPGSFIEKEKLFEIIDRIFAHYKSAVLAYTDIIANYNKDCTVKMAKENVNNTQILLLKILDSVKSAISDYYKSI